MKQFHEENPPIEEDFNPWDEKEIKLTNRQRIIMYLKTI